MMRTLYSKLPSSAPYLPFCHRSPHSAVPLTSPFLISLPPLRNSNFPYADGHRQRRPDITVPMASAPSTSEAETKAKPFSVLFVCLGNICRSPAAEGVFTDLVKKKGLDSKFKIDSAGTINYHEGNEADPRMRAAARRRGIQITSISRPIRPSDFRDFDLILAMDERNREDILGALERWSFREKLPADAQEKVRLMCSYCKKHDEREVPDPYYGGPQGFEKVLDLLEDACESLLDSILTEQ